MTKTDRIVKLLKEGVPRKEIAARVGCSPQYVCNIALNKGFSAHKDNSLLLGALMRALADCEVVRERGSLVRLCRRRFNEIPKSCGCSVATVKLYADSMGVVDRDSD